MAGIGEAFGQGAVIAITIKAIDEFSSEFKKAEDGVTGFSKKSAMMATTIVAAGAAAIGIMGKLAQEAAIAGDQAEAFNRVVGVDGPKVLEQMQSATLGTIDKFTLMSLATQAVNRGIKTEFIPTITEFSQRLADADPQFRNVADTVNTLTTAIATGRTAMLARMGIDVDATSALEEYAKKTVLADAAQKGFIISAEALPAHIKAFTTNMSEAEKAAALQDLVMARIQEKMTTLPVATKDAADKMAELNARFTEAKIEIGTALEPAFSQLLDAAQPLIPLVADIIKQLTPLLTLILKIAEALIFFLGQGIEAVKVGLLGFADMINTLVIKPIKEAIKFIGDLYDWVKKLFSAGFEKISSVVSSVGKVLGVSSKKVGDAVIRPDGQIIETDPKDYLIATKNPSMMGGGVNIYIDSVNGLDPDMIAEALQNKIRNVISI